MSFLVFWKFTTYSCLGTWAPWFHITNMQGTHHCWELKLGCPEKRKSKLTLLLLLLCPLIRLQKDTTDYYSWYLKIYYGFLLEKHNPYKLTAELHIGFYGFSTKAFIFFPIGCSLYGLGDTASQGDSGSYFGTPFPTSPWLLFWYWKANSIGSTITAPGSETATSLNFSSYSAFCCLMHQLVHVFQESLHIWRSGFLWNIHH